MAEGNGSTKKPLKREPLIAPRFKQAEYACTTYRAVLESGTTADELKEPKFWSHVAAMLRQYDEIVAIEESGAYRAHLVVTACDRKWAMVHVLKFDELRAQTPEESDEKQPTLEEYRVCYRGPHHKWRVERVSDNHVLFKEGQTRIEADTWLAEHRATLAKFVS